MSCKCGKTCTCIDWTEAKGALIVLGIFAVVAGLIWLRNS